MASQFGDGLFQAGMAGALLFNPDRAADPMAIARAFRGAVPAVFAAGAVRWGTDGPMGSTAGARRSQPGPADPDRRGRHHSGSDGAGELPLLCGALLANGLSRFVASGPVGGAAPCGAARAGGHDELGRPPRAGRSRHSWAPTSCCCPAGSPGPGIGAPPPSSSPPRFRWRSRCGCRCGSAPGCSARTTPGAPSTDRSPTR